MHLIDVMRYGHATLMGAIEDMPTEIWAVPGACGTWSIKDIVAHLASYEQVLIEITGSIDGGSETPTLDRFTSGSGTWNDDEVALRAGRSPDEIVDEYRSASARAIDLVTALPSELWTTAGLLSWYGDDYDLEDFVVYTFYGHKREHAGQIGVFRGARASGGA